MQIDIKVVAAAAAATPANRNYCDVTAEHVITLCPCDWRFHVYIPRRSKFTLYCVKVLLFLLLELTSTLMKKMRSGMLTS